MMDAYYSDDAFSLYAGDALEVVGSIPDASISSCITSPPYFNLRDYGNDGQYGRESTPAEYVETLRALFAEVRRTLADDGSLWLNLGDSYGKAKQLTGIPWRVAFALQDDGWTLRNAIVWHKPNTMPSSVTDRMSNRYETVFLLTKSPRYYFDLDAIREPLMHPDKVGQTFGGTKTAGRTSHTERNVGATYRPQRARALQLFEQGGLTADHLEAIRAVGVADTGKALTTQNGARRNRPEMLALADEAKAVLGGYYREFLTPSKGKNPGDVWTIATQPFRGAHFAVMPQKLVERCVLAGSRPGALVLDPFSGSGTVGKVALDHGRRYVGIDLSADYLEMSLTTRFADYIRPPWLSNAEQAAS